MEARKFKNEKYLYLLLGYTAACTSGGRYDIGGDKGRSFEVKRLGEGQNLLHEYKGARRGTGEDRRKTYLVTNINSRTPIISEYIRDGRNLGKSWSSSYPLDDAIDARDGADAV